MSEVTVNVSGTTFQFEREILNSRPYDRLSQMVLYATKSGQSLEFTVDRSDVCFEAILEFYKRGELHIPVSVCLVLFRQEMEYWGISQETLSTCCLARYGEVLVKEHQLNLLERSLPGNGHLTERLTRRRSFRERLWGIVDYRDTSCLAKLYLAVIMSLVLASIFFCAYSTDPHLRRPATKCELLDHLEETDHQYIDYIRSVIGNPDCTSPDKDETPFIKEDYDWTQPSSDSSGDASQQDRKRRSLRLNVHGKGDINDVTPQAIPVGGTGGNITQSSLPAHNSKPVSETNVVPKQHKTPEQSHSLTIGANGGNEIDGDTQSTGASETTSKNRIDSEQIGTGSVALGTHRRKRSFTFNTDGNYDNSTENASDNSNLFTTFGPDVDISGYTQTIVDTSSVLSGNECSTGNDGDGSQVNVGAARTQEIDVPELSVLRPVFIVLSILLLVLFIIDKSLRMYSSPSLKWYFMSVINNVDTLALVSHLIHAIVVNVKDSDHTAAKVFLCLQMFRIVRLLRLTENMVVSRVIQSAARLIVRDMFVVMLSIVVTTTFFGSLFYLIEENHSVESIPLGWYYAIITITTVGYDDVRLATGWGRFVACACALYGLWVIALVISVFACTFISLHQLALARRFTDGDVQQHWPRSRKRYRGGSKVGVVASERGHTSSPGDDDDQEVDYSPPCALPICCGKGQHIERDVLVPHPKFPLRKNIGHSNVTGPKMQHVEISSEPHHVARWPPRPISGLSVRPAPSFLSRNVDDHLIYTSQYESGLAGKRFPRQGSYDFSADDSDTNSKRPSKSLLAKSAYREINEVLDESRGIDADGDTDSTAVPASKGPSRERSKSMLSYMSSDMVEGSSDHPKTSLEMEERHFISRNDGSEKDVRGSARL